MHEFFVEVQFSDFVDPRPVVKQKFRRYGSEVQNTDEVLELQFFPVVHMPCVTQRQIPMAQKIGKAIKFFRIQFIDRPSMCVMQAVQVPQKKSLHV